MIIRVPPKLLLVFQNPMAQSWDPTSNRHNLDTSQSGTGSETFDMGTYNNSQIRSGKVTNYTMKYRRDTLKKGLDLVPTSLLLQRVPRGTPGTEAPSPVAVKPKVVRVLPKKKDPGPPERSKSKLWTMLSKKYSGKPVNEALSSEEKLRKVVRAFKAPVRNP